MRGYWEDYIVPNVDYARVQSHHIARTMGRNGIGQKLSIDTITNTCWRSIGFDSFATVK
jgi:hypothetical protein